MKCGIAKIISRRCRMHSVTVHVYMYTWRTASKDLLHITKVMEARLARSQSTIKRLSAVSTIFQAKMDVKAKMTSNSLDFSTESFIKQ